MTSASATSHPFDGPPGPPLSEADADSESSLVEALRRGDPQAFEAMVRTHAGRMLSVARRLLRNPEDARDAVQEALLSAFRALDGFTGDSRLSTWLHRIVVNSCLMRLRSRARRPEASIDDLLPRFGADGHAVEPVAAWGGTAHDELEREERRRLVRGMIDRLPDAYRSILILRDIEELDTEESARLLGITENAAKIRLHRARQALRALLDPHFRRANP